MILHLAVMTVNGVQNAFPRRQRDIHFAIEDKPQFFEGVEIQRVADDDFQRAVFLGHRQYRVLASHGFRHELDDRRRNDHFVQIDEVQAVLLGNRPHDFVPGGIAKHHQLILHLLSRRLGDAFGFGQLVGADDPLPNQDLGKIHFLSGHCRSVLG